MRHFLDSKVTERTFEPQLLVERLVTLSYYRTRRTMRLVTLGRARRTLVFNGISRL